MSEEKVGFKAANSWFLFVEEAILLYDTKRILVFIPNKCPIEEIKIITEEIILQKDELKEIQKVSELYFCFFEDTSLYNKLHISIMYNFFRRKGCFLKRFFLE